MEQGILEQIRPYLQMTVLGPFLRALVLLAVGIPGSFSLARKLRAWLTARYTGQHGLIGGQIVAYGGIALIVTAALNQLGFSLAPLLGAAGVLGVAVGFASQTSVSNIISGLFLLAEQPFRINDVVTVGDVTGIVISLDLLSVKMRTFDNKFVRVPHETIIKTTVTNVTRYPIRRVDVDVPVAYKEDVARVKAVLMEVVNAERRVLRQPEPLIVFKGFGNSSVDLMIVCWAETPEWFPVRLALFEAVKARLDAEGIEIPFPHMTVYPGAWKEPLPIRVHDGS